MATALVSNGDLCGMDTYSPASKYSSALTRLAKLVSPFEGLLLVLTEGRDSPPAVSWAAGDTLPSPPPRHNQYELFGLILTKTTFD